MMLKQILIGTAAISLLLSTACQNPTTNDAKAKTAPTSQIGGNDAASLCEKASLALDPEKLVAEVNGTKMLVKDMNKAFAGEQDTLLRDYCTKMSELQKNFVEQSVNEKLIEAQAKTEKMTTEEFVKKEMETLLKQPTEEEMQAFYNGRKDAQTPPYEQVKAQIMQGMMQQSQQTALMALLKKVRTGAKIETHLPDLSPAPFNIDLPAHTATLGTDKAKVTVIEFADFECPYCSTAAKTVKVLKEKYKDQVRFAYRHYPLPFHKNAQKSAEYAQCAKEQGAFWSFYDKAYENQKALGEDSLKKYVVELGLNSDKIQECISSGRVVAQIEADKLKAQEIGVKGTPSFFINGQAFSAGATVEALGAAIEKQLAN